MDKPSHQEGAAAPHSTILVVDDDLLILRVVTDLLVSNGYRVVTARDGRSGLRQVQRERPDLIILDLMMPEMDGFRVARQLRQDPESSGIPVIVLTSQADAQSREEALRSGADSYMVKPVSDTLLLTQIRSLLLLRSREPS